MSQSTPGDWVYWPGDGVEPPSVCVSHNGDMVEICELRMQVLDVGREPIDEYDECREEIGDIHANGNLISAAPDLLEACRDLIHQFSEWHCEEGWSEWDKEVQERARAAVAKATGGQS